MDLRRILAATDHTQLSPTATAADIARLCAEAARHRTASVCVAPARVREAKKELERLGVLLPVAGGGTVEVRFGEDFAEYTPDVDITVYKNGVPCTVKAGESKMF